MRKSPVWKFVCLLLFVLWVVPFSNARASTTEEIIGQEILYFTLTSTEDRAISYLDEYYGKHYLVMTFSPAAFTPI